MLYICSDPDCAEKTDMYAGIIRSMLEEDDFGMEGFTVLDGRNADKAAELISYSDMIILAGGHVPTQNAEPLFRIDRSARTAAGI